jgi:hypothetical protein
MNYTPPDGTPLQAPVRRMPTAQVVRLGFLALITVVGVILSIVMVEDMNYSPYLHITVGAGNMAALASWLLVLQFADVILGTITIYRFARPKART